MEVTPTARVTKGIDLDDPVESEKRFIPNYATRFITTHKAACKCAAFSPDGTHFLLVR